MQSPYRLFAPHTREIIAVLDTLDVAEQTACSLVDDGEFEAVEIQHLEEGLFGLQYYRVAKITTEEN